MPNTLRKPSDRIASPSAAEAFDQASVTDPTVFPRDCGVHELFEAMAKQLASHAAVRTEEEEVSYGDLDGRANRLAHFLVAAGVQQGERVGLFLDRGLHLIVGQLAILKAGAVYLPIDANAPAERVAFFASDAEMRTVLCSASTRPIDLPSSVRLIDLDSEQMQINAAPASSLGRASRGEDPAYVMYTSGSTGIPKGVVTPHRGIIRLVRAQAYFPAGADHCTLLLGSPGFDGTTYELYSALLNGGCCAVFPDRFIDYARLQHVIRELGVTNAFVSTGLFNQIVDSSPGVLQTLRHVLVGGEALSASHMLRAKSEMPLTHFGNGYGPTECTTLAVSWVIGPPEAWGCASVPLGHPLGHTDCYIVDADLRAVDGLQIGELLLGGDGLALGYLNRPELTAERFISNPFSSDPAAKVYRTGDRCHWLPNGMIAYVGRTDDQVKLNGYRVELGEVEAALRRCDDVENAAVVVHEYKSGTRGLVGCVIFSSHEPWCERRLLDALEQALPTQMVPSRILRFESLPLTLNGKVDRKQLGSAVTLALAAEALVVSSEQASQNGMSDLERQLVAAWRTTLRDENIGPDSDFFRRGGDSLLAVELESELERQIGRPLPGGTVHRYSSPRSLAKHLADPDNTGNARGSVQSALLGDGSGTPVFFMPAMAGYGLMPEPLCAAFAGKRPYFDRLTFTPIGPHEGATASIENIAVELLPQILAVRPHGPYNLAGYSFGGLLAFEVARLLELAGEQVEQVVLWDALPDSSASYRSPVGVIAQLAKQALSPSTWKDPNWISDRARYVRESFSALCERLFANNTGHRVTQTKGVVAEQVARRFRPKPYKGRLTLLYCTRSGQPIRTKSVAPYQGWAEAVPRENIDIVEFDCHHTDVLVLPRLAEFVDATRTAFDGGVASGLPVGRGSQ